jgi:hypothetical protein
MLRLRKLLVTGALAAIFLVALALQGCDFGGGNPGEHNMPSFPTASPGSAPGVFHQPTFNRS